ncbi:MAG: MlaD family protein [Opitutales bacterium]
MKTKLSPAVVGMFILGALLLAVVAFLSFGGTNFFAKPARFMVYFGESVSGLDPGASVKVNGVRMGRVVAINVRYDGATKKSLVQTICEIDRSVLTDSAGREIDLANPTELQNLIDRGLRARLSLTGITGLLFVELNFEDPHLYPADLRHGADLYPVIPAIPSPIAEAQAGIIEIIANLKRVDFPGLAKDLRTLIATTSQKLGEFDVKALAERVGRASDAVEKLATAPEFRETFRNLNTAITDTRTVLAHVDAQVGPAGDDLRKTLAEAQVALRSLDRTAQTTQRFVQAQAGTGDELAHSLQEISAAADALERLAAYVERNPNALIVGRKKP